MRVPGGGLLPGCWASGVGRSFTPDCPPSGRAVGAHYPLAVGAGGCGRGDPSPTPQRALFRAGFARCGGSTRAPGGGAPPAWVWGVRCRALSDPRLPALWAGCRGPLPTGCGCGGLRARGPVTNPTARALASWLCALWGRHEGARGRAPPAWVLGVRGRALSHPRLPALLAGCRGPLPTGCGCGGVRAWGPVTNPTARALSSWLCALWGRHEGSRGGAPPAWVSGVRGRALSHPRLLALRAGCRGPIPTGCGCGGVWAWGPVTSPTARALASWLCALWVRHEAARGGRLLPGCGASGVGRSPSPDCPPSGRAAGAHCPLAVGAGGCGRGDPSPTPQRALLRVGFARCGGGGRAPGGGRLLPACRASGVGRSPTPECPPSGRAAGAHYPLAVGAGGCGRGDPSEKPTARALASWLCALWGRHEGARGGRLLPGCGASGVGRSPTPDCPPSGRAAGAHYPLAVGAGGCGRGDPSPTPQRVLLRAGFARCGGRMRVPGGGAPCLGVGRPGSGALPPPTAGPLGGLPGPTTHWLWVRRGAGVGTRHQPHSARSFELALRAMGAAPGRWGGGRLLPGCGASGVGRSPDPDCPPSGRSAGAHYPLAVGAGGCGRGDPSPTPQRKLFRAGSARCGGCTRAPGGGRLLPGCGASGAGRSPTPDCPPSGRAAGAHYPLAVGAGGCGHGDPSPTPQRALLRAGFARCGGGKRAPGGGRLLPGCGASGVGSSPTPECPPSGRAAGAHYPLAVGAGGCGRGDPSPTPQRALFRAGFARYGGGTRALGGGAPPAWVWGVRCWALSRPRLPALWAVCRGPLPTGCGCGGVRAWGPVTNPTAQALSS